MKKLPLVILLAALLTGCGLNKPGDGEKVGQIVKLSKHGFFAKTWEAQIIRGGFSGGSGTMGQAFDFTVESDEQAAKVRAFMEAQTEVRIHYRTEGIYSVLRSDTGGDFLESIEPVKK